MKSGHKNGEIVIPILAMTIFFVILMLLAFAVCIYYVNIYAIVYDYKADLYNLNRNAIMFVNIENGAYGQYEYDIKKYRNKFIDMLKLQYDLDSNLQNKKKFIKQIDIIEYKIIRKGEYDEIRKEYVKEDMIHVETNITYIPIIFKNLFGNSNTFKIHNDIKISQYQ